MARDTVRHHDADEPRGGDGGGYSPPPVLRGYSFGPAEAFRARDEGRLLSVRLETSRRCNLRCVYCRSAREAKPKGGLSYDRLLDVVREARGMGASSVVVSGAGEPTMFPRFGDLIDAIHCAGMMPVVMTTCLDMKPKLARFLHQRGASVMGKLDSLKEEVHDKLTGAPGSFEPMREGLENLLSAGFGQPNDSHHLRLGATFFLCRSNMDEIEEIWRFCRSSGIFPNMKALSPGGWPAALLPEEHVSDEEVEMRKQALLEIDRREYGYDWLPHTPFAAGGCLQHLCSLYVTMDGAVRPCAHVRFEEHAELKVDGAYPHDINHRTLRDIYSDRLFRYVRHIDGDLEGKCSGCAHKGECIGCRGHAYARGVDQGRGPLEALRAECLRCFR